MIIYTIVQSSNELTEVLGSYYDKDQANNIFDANVKQILREGSGDVSHRVVVMSYNGTCFVYKFQDHKDTEAITLVVEQNELK